MDDVSDGPPYQEYDEQEEINEDDNDTDFQVSVTATINGTQYIGAEIGAIAYSNENLMRVYTNNGTGSILNLFFPLDLTVGPHTFGGDLDSEFVVLPPTGSPDTAKPGSGTFNITRYDRQLKIIEGTFEYITSPSNQTGTIINLTNGSFKLKYLGL